jgi:hypothetical protein
MIYDSEEITTQPLKHESSINEPENKYAINQRKEDA